MIDFGLWFSLFMQTITLCSLPSAPYTLSLTPIIHLVQGSNPWPVQSPSEELQRFYPASLRAWNRAIYSAEFIHTKIRTVMNHSLYRKKIFHCQGLWKGYYSTKWSFRNKPSTITVSRKVRSLAVYSTSKKEAAVWKIGANDAIRHDWLENLYV